MTSTKKDLQVHSTEHPTTTGPDPPPHRFSFLQCNGRSCPTCMETFPTLADFEARCFCTDPNGSDEIRRRYRAHYTERTPATS